jgi:hypothetical protein
MIFLLDDVTVTARLTLSGMRAWWAGLHNAGRCGPTRVRAAAVGAKRQATD